MKRLLWLLDKHWKNKCLPFPYTLTYLRVQFVLLFHFLLSLLLKIFFCFLSYGSF